MKTILLLAFPVFMAGAARGTNGVSFDEYSAAGVSPRMEGAASLYGGYDLFRAFLNPAMLGWQKRTWELGAATAVAFGGDQTTGAIAASWVGRKTEAGTFGGALLLETTGMASFAEIDLAGNETGVNVSPSAMQAAVAAFYQWSFFSLGAALHLAGRSYGGLTAAETGGADPAGSASPSLDVGTAVSLGKMDLGVSYHLSNMNWLRLGGSLRFDGWYKGALGLDTMIPTGLHSDYTDQTGQPTQNSGMNANTETLDDWPGQFNLGLTWNVAPFLSVRAGLRAFMQIEGGPEPRLGFTVPWGNWSFDYAFAAGAMNTEGIGSAHYASVTWAGGREREMPSGPRFFLKAEERTMAVAAFEPQGVSATDAAVISDMLRNRLIKEGSFNIVEKANMDKVLAEQAFQQTGCTSSECAVKLGKILNVKYLVVGSFGKALDRYVLSMRVIDVETAKAVYSDEATGANLTEIQAGLDQIAVRLTEAVKKAE